MSFSNMYILTTFFFKSPRNRFQKCLLWHSDKEDDVVCHHDLVVVLHASQGGSDLWLCEAGLTALVDVVHQGLHLHWLCMSRLEHCEERGLELLQPIGAKQQRHSYTSCICLAFVGQLQRCHLMATNSNSGAWISNISVCQNLSNVKNNTCFPHILFSLMNVHWQAFVPKYAKYWAQKLLIC